MACPVDALKADNDEGRLEEIQAALAEIQRLAQARRKVRNPEELEALESEVARLTSQVSALVVGQAIQDSLDSEEIRQDAKQFIGTWSHPMENDGKEFVQIRTRSGLVVTVRVSYFRRKGKRRSGKRNRGVYPGLMLLGIHDRCTPALASEISLLSAAMCSLEEARKVLSEMGIDLDIKTIRSITYYFAERARLMQQEGVIPLGASVSGRRVVVSCDGGRIRIRNKKRGKKTKKGRNRYKASWQEPRLLIVYVVDAEGRKEKSFAPFIDANMENPDALFAMLGYYLTNLKIDKADRVLFVADGAPWIWNRIAPSAAKWGIRSDQYIELIDFYHAVEHLGEVAALRKDWNAKKRKRWLTQQRRLLLTGQVGQVIDEVSALCRGRNSKEIRTHRNYFVKNADRMMYAQVKAMKLPIGSGAVESAIRRVINLRLKGASIYWCEESANAMLMLRSYYKAGRWNLLKQMANPNYLAIAA